jgi:hypothetical protein
MRRAYQLAGLGLALAVGAAVSTLALGPSADAASRVLITPREYHADFTVPAGSRGNVFDVKCPSGQLATGGGWAQLNFSTTLVVGTSEPDTLGNSPARPFGWAVIVDNPDAQDHLVIVEVICVPAH